MNSIERMLEHIIEMQRWAAQDPVKNDALLNHLLRVRDELERRLAKS
jgi:hypothetical protein